MRGNDVTPLAELPFFVPGFFIQALLGALQSEHIQAVDLGLDQVWRAPANDAGAMSHAQFLALLERACIIAKRPDLGLLLGRHISEANLHLLGAVIVASTSVRAAAEHVAALQVAMFGERLWSMEEHGELAVYRPQHDSASRVLTDLSITLGFYCVQRFLGPQHSDSIVAELDFALVEPADREPYRRVFGEQVRFGQSRAGIALPRALLDHMRPGTDPALAPMLRDVALERFSTTNSQHSWVARVERALHEHTQLAHVDMDMIAARWQLSARSLRRRLELEGERMNDILDRVRFARARRQLEVGNAPLSKLAESLGYSEVSAFQRAFKRWAKVGPGEYRTLVEQSRRGHRQDAAPHDAKSVIQEGHSRH